MERLIVTDACMLLKWVLPAEEEQNLAQALARVTSGVFVTADLKYLAQAGRDAHILPLSEWVD